MSAGQDNGNRRLLIAADLGRLGPVAAECFAPRPIEGVNTYLEAIAEIPRAKTDAVLLGFDATCRKLEAAVAGMKSVAADIPLVLCCDPAHEPVVRKLIPHGLDAYVIWPPSARELEDVLGIPSNQTQRLWIEQPIVAPVPTAEELARLADILARSVAGDETMLDAMASLICTALKASDATIVIEGGAGRAGRGAHRDAVLIEPILQDGRRIGQIRIGDRSIGGFTHEDTAKLRHYGVLFGNLLSGITQARKWQQLAHTDDLTGLPNRRRLLQFLDEKIELARHQKATVTALIFDIDDFKRYNDTYGHDAGDQILVEVGRLFQQCSRKSDLVARHGGDEFVVVFWDPEGPRTPGSQHPEAFLPVVQRFRAAMKHHTFSRLGREATGCLTISGGLAHFPWQASNATDLLEAADVALLQAKKAGKNRFWVIGDGPVCD